MEIKTIRQATVHMLIIISFQISSLNNFHMTLIAKACYYSAIQLHRVVQSVNLTYSIFRQTMLFDMLRLHCFVSINTTLNKH